MKNIDCVFIILVILCLVVLEFTDINREKEIRNLRCFEALDIQESRDRENVLAQYTKQLDYESSVVLQYLKEEKVK